MTAIPRPRAYSAAQFGEIVNVPEKTVRNLLCEGRIHGVKVGRRWVIPDWVLEEFLAKPS